MFAGEAAAVLMRANAAISFAAIGDREATDEQWQQLLDFVTERVQGVKRAD